MFLAAVLGVSFKRVREKKKQAIIPCPPPLPFLLLPVLLLHHLLLTKL